MKIWTIWAASFYQQCHSVDNLGCDYMLCHICIQFFQFFKTLILNESYCGPLHNNETDLCNKKILIL